MDNSVEFKVEAEVSTGVCFFFFQEMHELCWQVV